MENSKRSSATQHLSLVSTQIAAEAEAARKADYWQACSKCGQEYHPRVLVGQVCDLCRKADDVIDLTLADVFKNRALLVEMSKAEFLETDTNQVAYAKARAFNPATENMYLFGDVGTGKTMLACKVIRRAVAKRFSCAFVIAEEWLRSLYGATGLEQQSAIDRLASVQMLVIDDLGFEPNTDFSTRALYDVVNSRMLRCRNGLFVTSNLSLELLASRLSDDRLTSRIGGLCGTNVIEITGEDYRQK